MDEKITVVTVPLGTLDLLQTPPNINLTNCLEVFLTSFLM